MANGETLDGPLSSGRTWWLVDLLHDLDLAAPKKVVNRTTDGFELMVGKDAPQSRGVFPTLEAAIAAAAP